MSVRIANRGKQLLVLPLNSGVYLHLAPGEVSGAVDDREVAANDRVAKLLASRSIQVQAAGGERAAGAPPAARAEGPPPAAVAPRSEAPASDDAGEVVKPPVAAAGGAAEEDSPNEAARADARKRG